MKIFIKISLGFLVMFFWIVGLLFFDFYHHQRNTYQPFYPGLYISLFFSEYLGVKIEKNPPPILRLGECNHIQSIEGEVYDLQTLVPKDYSWLHEEDKWWFVEQFVEEPPKLFYLYATGRINYGQDLIFTVGNSTLHEYEIYLEKLNNEVWEKIEVEIEMYDSLKHSSDNKEWIHFFDKDQNEKKISYKKTTKEFIIKGKYLLLGNYRIVSRLGDHLPFYSDFKIEENPPIEWSITKEQLSKIDSFDFTIKNISGEVFYYSTYGSPYRIRYNNEKFSYLNGRKMPLSESTFGCGSTSFLEKCVPGEVMEINYKSHPLLWSFDLKSKNFPNKIKEIYGDSVGVKLSLWAYSSIWSKYRSSFDLYSKEYIIKTDDLIEDWKQKNNTL